MKREYTVRVVGTATVTIDDTLIESVDVGWRKQFYPLCSPQEIADHIGYNMLVNKCDLSDIDGFADRDDSDAVMSDVDWECE